ncbi:MAG: hypothetical protein U0O39_13300, partial [Akkermansia sp.]
MILFRVYAIRHSGKMLAFSSIPNRLPNPELSQCLPLKRTPDGRSPNFLPRKTNPLLKTEADHD